MWGKIQFLVLILALALILPEPEVVSGLPQQYQFDTEPKFYAVARPLTSNTNVV